MLKEIFSDPDSQVTLPGSKVVERTFRSNYYSYSQILSL
jgi:hypothetical protein